MEKEQVLAAIVEAITPAKKKKEKKANKILVVNGQVCPEMVTLKQAKKIVKQNLAKGATFEIYSKEGTLSIDLEVEVK